MKKRLLSLILAFVMVLGMLPAAAFAAEGETEVVSSEVAGEAAADAATGSEADDGSDLVGEDVTESETPTVTVVASGTCGEALTWTLVDGTLTVSGEGAMSNYENSKAPWTDYRPSITTVVIEDGVTSIGTYAFNGCANLSDVTLADGVTTIGTYAFAYSSKLVKVTFEGEAPDIDDDAFFGVPATTCYYPAGSDGWYDIVNAEDNGYGGTVTWVALVASGFCGADTDGDGEPNDNLYWTLTKECEYDENKEPYYYLVLDIAGSGAMMDYDLFSGPPWYGEDPIRTVNLPEGLTSIGNFAFVACGLSELVEIPSTVKSVGMGAFFAAYQSSEEENPALLTVTIPASVESIGMMAFASPLVEACAVEERNQYYCAVDGVLFTRTESSSAPAALVQYPLAKVGTDYTIPDGVTAIGMGAFMLAGEQLFRVTVPASVESVDSGAFSYCDTKWIHFVGAAPKFVSDAFSYSTLLCTYPAGDESWAAVETENTKAYDASSVIWKGVDETGVVDSGFCGAVTEEYPEGGNLAWTFYVDGTLEVTGSGAMCDNPGWSDYNPYMLKAVLPDGLTTIGASAFRDGWRLESIVIPDTVTSIGDYAFAYCDALASVKLGTKVTSIGGYAFAYCDALTEITIPGSVAAIGDYAFYECDALTCVTIGDGVLTVGVSAFRSCSALAAVEFGSEVQIIGASAFYDCDSLTVITLPDKVTTVGNSAFADCGNLTLISFGGGLKTLGNYAFSADLKLKSIKFTGMYPSCGSQTFGNVTATVCYPNNGLWGAASLMPTAWGGATALTWVATTDYTAPALSNAFAKTATDANLLWQMKEIKFDGDVLLAVMQSSNSDAGYESLSDIVTLCWTSPEDVAVYNWCGGQTLGTTEVHQGFNVWGVNVPVAYADGPAYMLALVDEAGNIAWELVELETGDVTPPAIAAEESEEEDEEPALLLEGSFKNDQGTVTWSNATPDTSLAMLFIDEDEDGLFDLDTDTSIESYECYVLEDGSWSITLSKDVCEEYKLKAGSEVFLLLMDGAYNMSIYTVTLTSSDDSEKPKVELKAEPTTAGGENNEIKIEIKATDNVGVKKVELVRKGLVDDTLKSWTVSDDDKTEWSDSYSWGVSKLDSGEHTLAVTVEDKAGNKTSETIKVTVDNTAPSIDRPAAVVKGDMVCLSWSCEEFGLVYEIYRAAEDEEYTSIGFAKETTFADQPGQGKYSYYVTAKDALGNEGKSDASETVLVDTVAPELNVYKAPDNKSRVWGTISFGVSYSDVYGVQSVTMSWTCGEATGTSELSDETGTIDTSGMAEGEILTVTFTAVDNAGNQSETVTLTYTIDNKPEAPTNLTAEVVAEGIALSWKASKPEDNVEKYVLMRAVVDAEGTVDAYEVIDSSIDKVTLGSVLTAVIANVVEDALKATIKDTLQTVLTGNPDITLKQVLENLDGYGLEDAAKTALEAAVEAIQCDYLDTDVEFGVTYSYQMLAQGYSGLVSESNEASATFVDETNPVVNAIETVSKIGEALFGGDYSEVPFDVDASDAGKGSVGHAELSYTVGGKQYTDTVKLPGTYTVDVSGWASGTYTFSATAYDSYGNASEPFETTITVDNTAPTIESGKITPADGSKISGETVQFTVPAADNLDAAPKITVTYKLNDTTLTAENGILNTVGLPEGEFTVTVTAADACGNAASQNFTFIVDNIPGIPVELAVSSDGTRLTVSWKDSAEQNAGSFVLQRAADADFTVDLTEWKLGAQTRSTAFTYADQNLVHGTTYYYRVKAVSADEVFSSDWSEPVSITFKDTVLPELTQFTTSHELCGGTTDTVTLTAVAGDNLGVSKIVLTCESWSEPVILTEGNTFDWNVSALNGKFIVTAVAYDAAGNQSDELSVTVTVDNTAPDAPAGVKAEGSYDYIRLTWAANADLVKEGGSYRIERDGVKVGTCAGNKIFFDDIVSDYDEHTYRVFAVDAMGNDAASKAVTAKKLVDTEKPVVFDVWPREGMTICHDTEVQASATDNWKVVKVEAGYALNGGETVWFAPKETDSVNPVVSFPWDVVELSGEATLYFKVTDAAGYTAERTETVNIMTYAAPAAPTGLTGTAGFKSVTLNWNEGDTTLLKQFKVYRVTDGGEELLANLRNNTYTLNGLTETVTLRVYAEDIYGTVSEKAEITLTPVLTESVAPVAVIQPKVLTGVVGSPVKFYGGNSTDNDAVKTYKWTFHNGETVEAVTTEKTYSAAGTYEVTLTVTDNSGNSASVTGTVTIYDVTGESATHTVLTVTVNDSTTLGTPLLKNVTVTVTNDDGFETSALTDSRGKAVLVVPQGECTLTAIKNGYAGAVRKIEVTSDEQGCAYQAVSLAAGGVSTLSGSLTAERMTYEDIKAAGIDVTNPANNHVVKQEFALRFVATPELAFDIPVTNYVNASGHCVGGVGLGWGTYVREDDHYTPVTGTPSVGEIIEDSVTVGIFPVGKSYYLVIYGETHWLKEMFHVELILVNNSYEEDVKDCIATLNLPEGLSLAAMLDYGQCARVSVGDIDRAAVDPETGTTAFDQAQVSWYVRGDVMGEYYLTADVTGNFVNDANQKTPINMTFETTESIKVYAGDALHLTITAQDTAYSEKEYRVQFKLENVSHKEDPEGVGIDLYNLSFGLTGAEQYSCIVWSDGTETRFEDLDKEDFGDKMTFRVPVLKPGQCITINFVTTCLFEADLASALVDKVTFGTMEIAFKLTDVFVTTLEGSTTEIPTDVILEPVPKATFTEWLWGEIKDAAKDGVKDAILQTFDALFFGGVPVTQYGVKVFEVGCDLLEDTKANSKAVVIISDGAYFLDSDNVIHTSGGAVVDPAALYSLRRNAGGVAVYTDAKDYTISNDGKTMTINGEGNLYVLRTGDTGDVEPEISVTTEYLVTNPKTGKYEEKTFTQVLKEDVKVDADGNVVTDDEGNPVLQDYSADLITATDVVLLAPTVNTVEIPAEGTVSVTFPHFMTDGAGTVATAAGNVTWTLTDATGEAVTAGMDLADGVLTVNSLAQPGVYTVTLSIDGTETDVSRSITLTGGFDGSEDDFICTPPTGKSGLVYTGTAQELVLAGTTTDGILQYALGTDGSIVPAEREWNNNLPTAVNAGIYHVWYRVAGDDTCDGKGAAYACSVTVGRKDVNGAVITLGEALTYDGQEQSQTVASVVVDGRTLAAGTDYTVTGNTAVDVGGEDYTLTVTGTGNYTGTAAKDWNLAKAGQNSPVAPAVSVVTQDSITLTAVAGGQGTVEYKCGDGLWQTSPEFTGLTAATRYTFAVRYTGDGNYNEAVSASADFYTAAATPGAGEGYAVDYVGEAVTVTDGYEVYTAVVDGTQVNSGSLVTPGTTLYIRVAANGEIPASAWTELTIPARPAAPSELQGIHETIDGKNDGRITGITTAMEYSSDSIRWTGCTAEAVTDLADGTYQVRVKAVDGVSFAGAHAYAVISAGRKIGVFFEENGGIAVDDRTGLTYNTLVTLPEITRAGYTFDGWAIEADGDVVYAAAADVTVTADMTLYAKWTPITYTVKFDANGGSGTMADQILTYDTAQKLTRNAFTRSGYTFTGWNTATDGSGTGYSNGCNVVNLANAQDAVITLYARWEAVYYPPAGGGTPGGTAGGTTSTITKNEDGSTTTTETDKKTGTVIETTTKSETTKTEDGSTVTTDTKVEVTTTKDGAVTSTAETVTKTKAEDGSTTTETVKEETVSNKDGSATTTTTTKTETADKTETVEVKEETVTKEDGTTETKTTSTTTAELADGTTATSTTDETGKTEAQVTVSEKAAASEEPVVLPIPAVSASNESETASTVVVTNESEEELTVIIPVEEGKPGAVVVVVNEDGTEEVQTKTALTEEGLTVKLEGSATVKVVDNSKDFTDVKDDAWYNDGVAFASGRELFNGVGNDLFDPSGDMTRGMFATVLHRMEDEMEHSYDGTFHDVDHGHWYTDGVHWAADHGLVEGYGNDYFGTNDSITREQMITLVFRYMNWLSIDTSARGELTAFTDHEEVSDWATEAVQWGIGVGIIEGVGNDLLDPNGHATRAQIAVFMQRVINLMYRADTNR